MTKKNEYVWNKTLKFSWGHIIAFVAIIFISYVAYMGDFYLNGGNFINTAKKVGLIDLFIFITFIGAQICKAADKKFDRAIIIERILICMCPIVFIWAMLPCNHFWNVLSKKENIEQHFDKAIDNSRQMFDDYDNYSKNRIKAYDDYLKEILIQLIQQSDINVDINTLRENYVETLTLQLLSQNTDSLKTSARAWIKNADQGASVWNAFLIGNVDIISQAIKSWNQRLTEVSQPKLSNEPFYVEPFDVNKQSFQAANSCLCQLKDIYTKSDGINLNTIWTGLILFLMLLFPYYLQDRCTRTNGYYYLIPNSLRKNNPKINKPQINNDSNYEENNYHIDNEDDIYSGTF